MPHEKRVHVILDSDVLWLSAGTGTTFRPNCFLGRKQMWMCLLRRLCGLEALASHSESVSGPNTVGGGGLPAFLTECAAASQQWPPTLQRPLWGPAGAGKRTRTRFEQATAAPAAGRDRGLNPAPPSSSAAFRTGQAPTALQCPPHPD